MTHKTKLVPVVALSALSIVSCSTKGGNTATPGKERDLIPGVEIIYSANLDGEIEPCGCRSNPTGGLHRRWNLLHNTELIPAMERLQVDSGDLFYQSTPTPPFLEKQWNYQAEVLRTAYNAFGVEVITLGELDFSSGLEQLLRLAKGAKFKIVTANIYRRDKNERLFDPYVILNKGGKKVGIFGVYDGALGLPEQLFAKDHIEEAKEAVKALRAKADVVIALTHIGLEKDIELAKAVPGIDAIFGAHTQSFLTQPEKVGDTLIFQTSFRGQHLGVYLGGESKMFQIDERFESKPGSETAIDKLVQDAKTEIARINKETESELMGSPEAKEAAHPVSRVAFQTFAQCAQCHAAQYEFHKKTPHMSAFMTLVKNHQSSNLDCLKCHTVGANQPEGWTNVNKLVLNATDKPISAESFAKSLPNMKIKALAKLSKTFINVQCENCHGAGGGHPISSNSKITKAVTAETCFGCHTADRAPGWYKDGKPDMTLVEAKLKSMSCPVSKK